MQRKKNTYYDLHRDQCLSNTKAWQKKTADRYRWVIFEHSRKKRNLESDFTEETFTEFVQQACRYCGTIPALGIDRVDNFWWYTKENSVPCCGFCNRAKKEHTLAEFEAWLDRVAAFRNKR